MLENAVQKAPVGADYVEKVPHLNRVYALSQSDIGEMRAIYDEWAATYDNDLAEASQDYVGPAIAAAYAVKTLGTAKIGENVEILDAGCGTGLVGINLAKAGGKKIDGIDLSPGMLDVARETGAYRALDTADLSKPMTQKDDSYDILTCVGTLTQGHVGPGAINEFVRVVKPGGAIVATILDSIYSSGGYDVKIQQLETEGKVKILSTQLEDYRRGAGVRARMCVLEVL